MTHNHWITHNDRPCPASTVAMVQYVPESKNDAGDYARIVSGPLSAMVTRGIHSDIGALYECFLTVDGQDGSIAIDPFDFLHFVKFFQLLSFFFVDEGWMPDELHEQLTLLSRYLGMVLDKTADPFGVCPFCLKNDGYVNVGSTHFFVCHQHELRWRGGKNLFGTLKRPAEEKANGLAERVSSYSEIQCVLPG